MNFSGGKSWIAFFFRTAYKAHMVKRNQTKYTEKFAFYMLCLHLLVFAFWELSTFEWLNVKTQIEGHPKQRLVHIKNMVEGRCKNIHNCGNWIWLFYLTLFVIILFCFVNIYPFICKAERYLPSLDLFKSYRERRDTERPIICWFPPQMATIPELSWSKARTP